MQTAEHIYWFFRFWIHRLLGLKYYNKSAWMPVKDGKVLFARSKKEEKLFYCVGGKLERGETDIQALIRETMEEVSVALIKSTFAYIRTFYGPAPDGRPMRMACYNAVGDGEPVPSGEVEELAWFTSADTYRTTYMGVLILHWMQRKGLIS